MKMYPVEFVSHIWKNPEVIGEAWRDERVAKSRTLASKTFMVTLDLVTMLLFFIYLIHTFGPADAQWLQPDEVAELAHPMALLGICATINHVTKNLVRRK